MVIKGNICQSGGKQTTIGRFINEDGLINFDVKNSDKTYKFILLMDGATGLGRKYEIINGQTPAEWYVTYMMSEIRKELFAEPTKSIYLVIESCILKASEEISKYEKSNNIILKEYEKPSASLSLLRTDGETTDIYLIGDLETIVAYKNGEVLRVDNPNQKAVQALDKRVLKRMAQIAKERNCSILDTRNDSEIESMLQINRSKKNVEDKDGYWICGTTPGIAEHGVCINFENSQITDIILASDGFDYSLLNLNEKSVYEQIKKYGVGFVSKSIKMVQDGDEKCNKFPRFKKSDDLTVVHIDYLEYDKDYNKNEENPKCKK